MLAMAKRGEDGETNQYTSSVDEIADPPAHDETSRDASEARQSNRRGQRTTSKMKRSNLYKTQLCRNWKEEGECRFGNTCHFAHGREELQEKGQSVRRKNTAVSSSGPAMVSSSNGMSPMAPIPLQHPFAMPYGVGPEQMMFVIPPRHSGPPLPPQLTPMVHPPGFPPIMQYQPQPFIFNDGMVPRSPSGRRFKTRMCKFYLSGDICPYGTQCAFAHGEHELDPSLVNSGKAFEQRGRTPRPDLYKTRICKFHNSPEGCPFGQRCYFAHGQDELRAAESSNSSPDELPLTPSVSEADGVSSGQPHLASGAPLTEQLAALSVQPETGQTTVDSTAGNGVGHGAPGSAE